MEVHIMLKKNPSCRGILFVHSAIMICNAKIDEVIGYINL